MWQESTKKSDRLKMWQVKCCLMALLVLSLVFVQAGCRTPSEYREEADSVASDVITEKQKEALGRTEPFGIERPSETLRRRLIEGQDLQYSDAASLGTDKLEPVAHWPEEDYPPASSSPDANIPVEPNKPTKINLVDALQIGARNSFDYQSRKESVFRAALDLDLTRNEFRNIFGARADSQLTSDTTGDSTVTTVNSGGSVDVTRRLKSGLDLTGALAIDLGNLLTQGGASSLGLAADATASIPLLRGSGKHIVTEPLTQAERNVVYAIYDFERFKRTFAVNIARDYLGVLRQLDQIENSERNYRSRIVSARYIRRLADAGRRRQIEVDQALQSELGARNGWISAQEQYRNRLDAFKTSIGLPPDAQIELDRRDLELLRGPSEELVKAISNEVIDTAQETPAADADVALVPASKEDAGPFEIDQTVATKLALDNRLDLRVAVGEVYDAQRQVVVSADALRAGLTLGGSASFADNDDDGSLSFDGGRYSALLSLDLPVERTRERNAYRNSLIGLEQATRSVQSLEDQIKLSIRSALRSLLESREGLNIQARSVVVAQKQVKMSNMFLEAGLANMRDLREAQDSLLAAENELTRAVITYRTTELELQRDMGLLQVDEKGLWQEFSPEVVNNVQE